MKRQLLAYRGATRRPPREWSVAIISFYMTACGTLFNLMLLAVFLLIGPNRASPVVVVLLLGPFLVLVGGMLALVGLSESGYRQHFAIASLLLLVIHIVAAVVLPGSLAI